MSREPSLLPVAATLLALAGVRDGETVLDAGCGSGLLTHPAAAAAGPRGRVYGLDADPAKLALARERRPSGVCWVRGDPACLPFASGSVDKVICGAVHLADLRPALAECARVLAPGGRVAVSAWGDDDVLRALAEDGGVAGEPADLPGLLRDAGLRVAHREDGEVALPFAGAAAYAAWRLPSSGATVADRVGALLGPGPVVVRSRIHYATATAGG